MKHPPLSLIVGDYCIKMKKYALNAYMALVIGHDAVKPSPDSICEELGVYICYQHEAGRSFDDEFTVIYGSGIVLTVRRYYDTFYIANIEWLGIDALIYPVFSWQVIYRGLRRMITKVLCGWAGKPVSRPLQFIRCY